ncbi:hypothetical protein CW712_02760 [Candidatus Bathyarchaeota archaeon]|nr:MAG: hypothetical protein CW712_02760 [Candidatus Bathyarchaeota archaeon]
MTYAQRKKPISQHRCKSQEATNNQQNNGKQKKSSDSFFSFINKRKNRKNIYIEKIFLLRAIRIEKHTK